MISSTWGLLALLGGGSSLAIVLAHKTKFGAKLGYVLCAQLLGIVLVNLNIVPASSSISAVITGYFVPFAVVLLLFFSDIRQILKVGPKQAINAGLDIDLDSGLQMEANLFGLAFATQDKHEGMTAFLEKRKEKHFSGQ